MVKVTSILVNGVEIKSTCFKWKVVKTYGDTVGTCEIECNSNVNNLLTLENGQSLEVWRGASSADYRWLLGKVNTVEDNGPTVKIYGISKFADEQNSPITKSYDYLVDPSAGVISAIALDMVTTYGGMNADSTTFVNTGLTNIITRWVCNHDTVFNQTKKMLSIVDNFHYFDDHQDKVFAQPIGYESSATVLTVGSNVVNVPKWKRDRTPIVNYVEISGAEDTVWTTESFDGDGSEDTFELDHAPKHVDVYVGGTEQVGGKTGSTSGAFDYEVDEDFENLSGNVVGRIIFQAGSIPGVGVGNIVVNYAYGVPTPVVERDLTSISLYGMKLMQVFLFEAKSVADAQLIGRGIIDKRKDEFVSTSLEVLTAEGLHEGMTVRAVDSINGYDLNVAINQLEIRWPDDTDKVSVGDASIRITDYIYSIADRLLALEKEQSKNQDILYQGFNLERGIEITRTLQRTTKKNYNTFDVGICGSPIGTGASTYTTTADFNRGTVTGDCIVGTNQLEVTPISSDTTDAHGVAMPNSANNSANSGRGFKIHTNVACQLKTVTKHAGCAAISAKLYDAAHNLLDTQAFVGNDATFAYDLSAGTDYYILGFNTVLYATQYSGFTGFPFNKTNLNFTKYATFDGGSTWYEDTSGVCADIVSLTTTVFTGSGTWTSDRLYFSHAWGWNVDCFGDSDVSDWAVTGANWTVSADATSQLEGTNSMKIIALANSSGTYCKKTLSNEDASDYRYLHIYAKANSTASQLLKVTITNNGVDTDVGYITLTASGVAQDFSFDLNAITHNDLEGIKITSNSNDAYTAYIDRVVLTNSDSDTSTFKSISWNETGSGVTCDILNAITGATLVSGYTESSDLKAVLPIDAPIKVKMNLTGNPTVQDVTVNWIPAYIGDHYGEEETA